MNNLGVKIINFAEFSHIANTGKSFSDKPSELHIRQLLSPINNQVDQVDDQIASLLGERFRLTESIAKIKQQYDLPVRIDRRIDQILERAEQNEEVNKLPPRLGYFLWREIVEASCHHEEIIQGKIKVEDEDEDEI